MQDGEECREIRTHRRLIPTQVGLHVHSHDRLPYLLGGLLAYGAFVQLLVLVDRLVQIAQLVIEAGRSEGRRLMADGDGTPPAPGLNGLADVVLDIGIEDRQVADGEKRIIIGGQAAILSWQPLLCTVGAEVDQRIGAEALAHQLVSRHVEMVRRHLAVVVGLAWPPRSRWLG